MIPLNLTDLQIVISVTVFILGCLCIFLGAFLLITRSYSKEIKALAQNSSRIGQKGITDEVAGLVSSASELVTAVNELVKTSSGVGVFLIALGLAMIAASYWVIMQIEWPM
jgi:hypothetical protein